MDSQKADNLLNLALDATEEERQKSLELDQGYNPIEKEWEVIVKYSGNPEEIQKLAVSFVPLMGRYAVAVIRESNLEAFIRLSQIEYVEKPKALFFEVADGRRVSCINAVQDAPFSLSGRGTLVAVLDSGIDYTHPDFRNPDGTTRILALWDQTIPGNPPAGYAVGSEYTSEDINEALRTAARAEQLRIVPSQDRSGHGTAVAGVAAGNGRASDGVYRGVAPESGLIIVKLGVARENGFPRTTELMQAADYAVRKAAELGMPVAINVSFGNTYGSHRGNSLLERFLDNLTDVWKNVISVGSGNEAASAGHTSGRLTEGEEEMIPFAIQERQTAISVQIWKNYVDEMQISLITPSGVRIGPIQEMLGTQRFRVGQTEILLYYGEPSPYSTNQEIFLNFLPQTDYLDAGIWRIVLIPERILDGSYELWLPGRQVLNTGTGFLYPKNSATITIPSTASRVITVGAYDARTFTYADFSGQGREASPDRMKPDLAAPGVRITTTAAGGGYAEMTGTSFAVPFVTGSAALLMEWGIVNGNDPYLYGEKVKAYLRRGARALPGFTEYPNPQVGYGALCVRDSLPVSSDR